MIEAKPYQYDCTVHGKRCLGSPKPIRRCPIYRLGSPCHGTLTRVGPGSRKEKAE